MQRTKTQSYTLGLISVEALNNECVRLIKRLEGKPEEIIGKILKENLKTEKDFIVNLNGMTSPTQFAIKMLPTNRRPFDIISSLCVKSVKTGSGGSAGSKSKAKTSREKDWWICWLFFLGETKEDIISSPLMI